MVKMQFKTNAIYCGDCLDVLRHFPEDFVDLIYLDPPFSSGRIYNIVFGTIFERKAFDDRWEGGIYHYVQHMKERLELCKRILSDEGSIYLHCDWHASHYLKIIMDEIFGYNNLNNEIIWSYKRYTASSKNFQRLHDVIFFYSKTKNYKFNILREDYGSKSGKADSHYKQDNNGRWFRWQKRKGQEPYKVYLSEGRRMGDVWELPLINASATERLGYPTQKPEKLLKRIIKASSNEKDIVLDPFCGCGTTLAVAHKLHRKWIGIDISPMACKVMKKRMGNVKLMGINVVKNIPIIGLPKTEGDLRKIKPFEFENWVCDVLFAIQTKKAKDMGIDGFMLDGTAIQAKQMDKVGRPIVDEFAYAVKRAKKTKGIIVSFGFTKDAIEEIARAKKEGIEIIHRTVKELLEMGF